MAVLACLQEEQWDDTLVTASHRVELSACFLTPLQGILDVLNWQLPKEDYHALCDLPQDSPQKNLEDLEPEADSVKYLDHLTPPQLL